MARSDNSWLHLYCPTCGLEVFLEDETIVKHSDLSGETCGASGHRAEKPKHGTSLPYDCDVCGQRTRSNARSTIIHSHNIRGTTTVCRNSGKFIGPLGMDVTLVFLPPKVERPAKPSGRPAARNYHDAPARSVRTVSAGLPSLGRRH